MAESLNNAQLLAIGMTLADRWPLLNALPVAERTRIQASLRRLRVATLADRAESPPDPSLPSWATEQAPGQARDAGTLYRGEFRGVRGDPRARPLEPCPWAGVLWPMTPAGDVIACSCGVADRVTGAIAGQVNARLWRYYAHELVALAAAEARDERIEWWRLSSRARHEALRTLRAQGQPIEAWRLNRKQQARTRAVPTAPTAPTEGWDAIKARILAAPTMPVTDLSPSPWDWIDAHIRLGIAFTR